MGMVAAFALMVLFAIAPWWVSVPTTAVMVFIATRAIRLDLEAERAGRCRLPL